MKSIFYEMLHSKILAAISPRSDTVRFACNIALLAILDPSAILIDPSGLGAITTVLVHLLDAPLSEVVA